MPIANLDLDIVAYQVASACEGKWWKYKGEKWDSKVELNKKLKEDGVTDDGLESGRTPEEWPKVKYSLNSRMEEIIDNVNTFDFVGHLTGKSNFRYKIATILPYKGNRNSLEKPFHLDACRQFLVEEYNAKVSVGMEADDAIGLAHNPEDGDVIATLDKDLNCIYGKHYNWTTDKWTDISELDSYRSFFSQMITGDTTDNILGLYNMGAKSAVVKKIGNAESVEEMVDLVYPEYTCRFGEYAESFYEETAKLLWILQRRDNPIVSGRYWE